VGLGQRVRSNVAGPVDAFGIKEGELKRVADWRKRKLDDHGSLPVRLDNVDRPERVRGPIEPAFMEFWTNLVYASQGLD